MAKRAGVNATLAVADDGTLSVKVAITDADGLDITTLTAWPPAVALPTATLSDANPGPSSGAFTQNPTPPVQSDGSFLVGSIAIVAPPSVPPPAGWGQNVDVQVTIASGLTGQTAPVSEDAGTYSTIADANKPSGFVPVISNP